MIGIIGGTGLYRMEELELAETRAVDTPFGPPSAPLVLGSLRSRRVVFLARHGLKHHIIPSEINYRANLWALKSVGVRTILGVSAVGSLRTELAPGDLALPAQYLDFTKGLRASSYFGAGVVAHVPTAKPICTATAALVARCAGQLGMSVPERGTYACVEGPRFGTRAESFFLRTAGADLVGMTNVPEAFLACEAQLSYCSIAVVTDYDSWMDDSAHHVTLEQALQRFNDNLARVQRLLASVVENHRQDESLASRHTLAGAVVTPRTEMSAQQRELVDFLSV